MPNLSFASALNGVSERWRVNFLLIGSALLLALYLKIPLKVLPVESGFYPVFKWLLVSASGTIVQYKNVPPVLIEQSTDGIFKS